MSRVQGLGGQMPSALEREIKIFRRLRY